MSVIPGRRVQITLDALKVATDKCIKVLADDKRGPEAIAKCFPTYAQSHMELLDALRKLVVEVFNDGIPKAWEVLNQQFNFIPLANALDDLLLEAETRMKAGEKPKNMYLISADPSLSIPAKTLPLLEAGTASLKAKRLALQKGNEDTYKEIQRLGLENDRVEKRTEEVLLDFEKSMKILEKMDFKELERLREQLDAGLV